MKTFAVATMMLVLTACAKGGNSGAAASASASAEANNPASASDGAVVYRNNCSSCHQPDGRGLRGAFPPLAGNPTVTGNPTAVIVIVKNGLEGRVVVNGVAYSGIMPHWGGVLSDDQIASVVTYIRSSWHNSAPGVSLAQVRAVK
ncbi:MAG: cytochrome c [Candidatus Eremiobacteraeota bacterium]|nr:cytochrome c [Candidatus Eremiobacteraeota bacterium]MBV9263006.1 cytochrome c [Candidatus Eremiobacteraeota bacterium]